MASRDPAAIVARIGKLVGAGAIAGVLVATIALPAVGGAGLVARGQAERFQTLPTDLKPPPLPQRSRILAADGSTVATFYNQNRISVPLEQIAPVMRNAMVAIEDSRFYQHNGVDMQGMLRALAVNLRTGEITQGGSTLTQQYVENVLILKADSKQEKLAARGQTISGKLREVRYALAIEQQVAKRQILQRYLNIAYFGDGAYGVEAAARHYFNKNADHLKLAEAALIAGLVKAPGTYNPVENPKAAKQRRNVVISRMAELGMVSQREAEQARRTPLGLDLQRMENGCTDSKAPFFCLYVIQEIRNSKAFGKTREERVKLLRQGGLTIRTTLDPDAQRAARKALRQHVPPKNSSRKAAAEAMVEPGTGKIRALAVSRDFGKGKFKTSINLAANYAHGGNNGFQAGSTFKTFTLATALAQGKPFSFSMHAPYKATVSGFEDCKGRDFDDPYTLSNAIQGEAGKFNLKRGTWLSVNTFFVKLEKRVGLCNAVRMAQKLGLRTAKGDRLPVVPSFTLGTAQVAPLDMAAAYATFASGGIRCNPIAITKVIDRDGNRVKVPGADCHRVIPKGVAAGVNYILQGVLNQGTASASDIARPAAGKTGSVNNYSSAWFVGYTPDLSAAVWLGDPRGGYDHPLKDVTIDGQVHDEVYGATIPAPIWAQSMSQALAGTRPTGFSSPPGSMFYVPPKPEKKEEESESDEPGEDDEGETERPGEGPPEEPGDPDHPGNGNGEGNGNGNGPNVFPPPGGGNDPGGEDGEGE